ncbi:unnamed protein product [Blepharisma stoltei]|uniref:ubiquitinyl hydrolase 1 n=1 Tax=Blepharisma stoltei TaxID=1481888 RepID=A0AAU9JTH1_9CILI|nr:unnamed protein product [Blepharisma stoltei]
MKIPEDQKYWDLCASICLINTISEYLHNDEDQISSLMQIEQALKDSQKFNLKEESIKQLWDHTETKKDSIWSWLNIILDGCYLWNLLFYREENTTYISSLNYWKLAWGEYMKNKSAYLACISSTDKPKVLLENSYGKFLLVLAFSNSEKIMYYFKKNSWFALGNREESMVTFLPDMYLLYIRTEDCQFHEDINYAEQFLILNSMDNLSIFSKLEHSYYSERYEKSRDIETLTNENDILKKSLNKEAHKYSERLENQERDIERLTAENETLNKSVNEASGAMSKQKSEIEKLKNEISNLKQLLNNKEREAENLEKANKALESELNKQKQSNNSLQSEYDKLMQYNNNLSSKNKEQVQSELEKFYSKINQACDELNQGIISTIHCPEAELVRKDHTLKQYDLSASSHLKESKTSIFPNIKQGIPNLGNTCYLNSVLQIFASTNTLFEFIGTKEDSLSIALYNVLLAIRMGSFEALVRSLKSEIDAVFPMFLHGEQQDAKELLVTLFDHTLDARAKSLFSFCYHEKLPCDNCGKVSLLIREENLLLIPSHETSITSFLNKITEPKSIQGQGLKCESCNQFSIFKTEITSIESPHYLIFYLSRSENGNPRPYNFLEETLTLNSQTYCLYGVICYYKNGNGGHYTAFTRDGDQWNNYNDNIVGIKTFDQNDAYLGC